MDPKHALAEFLEEKRSNRRSAVTILFYQNLLTPFVTSLGRRHLTDIAPLLAVPLGPRGGPSCFP